MAEISIYALSAHGKVLNIFNFYLFVGGKAMEIIMNVKEFVEKLNLKVLTEGDMEREITDCYIGDLLSWVMGRAPEDCAWLTVMGNINSIAVATLADVSCIVLTENAPLDEDAKKKAEMHDVTILSTEENGYKVAVKLSQLI